MVRMGQSFPFDGIFEHACHQERRGVNTEPIRLNDLVDNAYQTGIFICMRTTLNIDDQLLVEASDLTGVKEKTALVRMGLQSLIARESARKLAKLGGTEPQLQQVRRRKSA